MNISWRKGKSRRRNSPYDAPLFFAKGNDKSRGVVDFRAVNRTSEEINTSTPGPDEMFDQSGGANAFSEIDLETGFHQSRLKAEDVE